MKVVIVYGTFDYFHYGHYNFLKQAKALGDYLIVGVSTDALCLKKGKQTVLDENKRFEIVSSLNFVDKVIFEYDFDQKISDVDKYHVDIFADGEDYKDIFPGTFAEKALLQKNCQIIYLKRTSGVSTTDLKNKLAQQVKLDETNTDNLRAQTDKIRKEKF